jgi:hypothetical protein
MTSLANVTALLLLFWQGTLQTREPVFEQVLENERVAIWRIAAEGSGSTLRPGSRFPSVLISVADGSVRDFERFDARAVATVAGAADLRRAVLIQVKGPQVALPEPPAGIPRAFPRPDATRALDNDRFAVWDLTWTQGMRTPLHFHDRDVVAVYLGTGTVRSIPLSGAATATRRSFGEAVFLPRGRTHVEECLEGPRRDIIVEIK